MMTPSTLRVVLVLGVLVAGVMPACARQSDLVERGDSPLDRYTAERDDSFAWEVVRTYADREGMLGFAIDLTSQTWRQEGEVDYPQWTHMMQVVVPDELRRDGGHATALLLIGGGQRQSIPPERLQEELWIIAQTTGTIVAAVPNVPNQPLSLPNPDGTPGDIRFEDDLLAESWVLAQRTGDDGWVIHQAMVESAVAAMDAIQAFAKSEEGGGHEISDFVVSGGSKRGWTAWLTAAVDDRVRAIIPMVIDVLNLPATMRHHYGAYGFYAPAIGDYAGRNLMQELDTPEGLKLRRIVDPYLFRDRLTMPKLMVNTTGDQYFLPDTTRYYFDELPGVTRMLAVPNWDHAIDRNGDAIYSAVGFYEAILGDVALPELDVEVVEAADGGGDAVEWLVTVKIEDERVTLRRLTLWEGTNPDSRDFRQVAIGRPFRMHMLTPIEGGDDAGKYRVRVEKPESGYTAFFVEDRYDVQGQNMPLVFTTQVGVLPDVLEHDIAASEPEGERAEP
jgi:PhoPQ-activated pathogenicity-related protein